MPEKGRKRILIVDDEEHTLMVLEAMLENEGYEIATAWSGRQALNLLRSRSFDLVLLDDYLFDVSSDEVLRQIHRMKTQPLVIVMQAKLVLGAQSHRLEALGACEVIGKWRPRREITQAVHNWLGTRCPQQSLRLTQAE